MLRAISLAIVAVGWIVPATAQQQTPVSPAVRQEVEAVIAQWEDAINKGDAKKAAALFTQDAINLDGSGMATTPESIEAKEADVISKGITLAVTVETVQPVLGGDAVLAAGPFSATFKANPSAPRTQGNWVHLLIREGNAWKIRMTSVVRSAGPGPGGPISTMAK